MTQIVQPYALARDEGKSVWFLGTLVTFKATGEETHNGFGLIEQVLPPGFAPPLHVHHNEDEAFYLLEGEITFHSGEQTLKGTPGTFVFFPREIPHWFLVEGDKPARLLQFNTPVGLEHFFAEMGEPAQALTLPPPGAPDIEKMLALASKYNFEIIGPPPHDNGIEQGGH
jgi:quercetin dioxygenase-like cupin family protein